MSLYAVDNPATGERVQEYPTISDAELEAAIGRADTAFRSWGRTSEAADRARLVNAVAELHTQRRDELAATIVREMGKPVSQALGEVDFAADIYRYYAETSPSVLEDEPIALRGGEGSALIRRTPLGVLLGIMPWNFPYYQVARFAGPNLMIGNTILLKHAPQCPQSALAIERMFHDAGFPDGAYVNIFASNEQIATVIADRRVQGVSLTGSERAGAAVAEIAGRNLKKVVLELGGSDPFIVLSANDLDAVAKDAAAARLDNNGQSCNAAKRFIVVDELYSSFVDKLTRALALTQPSDPTGPDSELGPLSSSAAADRLQDQLDRAVAAGARMHATGERRGNFFAPIVLSDIGPDNPLRHEEFFGPVASVYRAADEDDAVRLANDIPFGLGSYVYTTDPEQAQRVADKIDAGMVFVNVVLADGVELPFGGVKRSGTGRELGRLGADEFVNKKLIRLG